MSPGGSHLQRLLQPHDVSDTTLKMTEQSLSQAYLQSLKKMARVDSPEKAAKRYLEAVRKSPTRSQHGSIHDAINRSVETI